MKPVTIGAKGKYEFVVTQTDLAGSIEPALPMVLATFRMSLAMEQAAIAALTPFLEPGEMSVGATVNVSHTAATPIGWKVRAEAEVTGGEGRRVEFVVRAYDEKEEIGSGTHTRAVLLRTKFDERFAEKVNSK
jgi:fluoroacetyl-CoA thioesterase